MPFSDLSSLRMDLKSVIYISYLIPSERIRTFVPRILPLMSDANNMVFVSLVAMKCQNVRFSMLPWPRFNYDQLNLRTYVTDPVTGEPAVYFFRSGVSMGIVPVMTRIIGIPWERISFSLDTPSKSRYHASGNWLGYFHFEVESSDEVVSQESTVRHLTGPMVGFMGAESKPKRFRIDHRALEVNGGKLDHIHFPFAIENGFLTEEEMSKADSMLVVPNARFVVYLPPRSVKRRR